MVTCYHPTSRSSYCTNHDDHPEEEALTAMQLCGVHSVIKAIRRLPPNFAFADQVSQYTKKGPLTRGLVFVTLTGPYSRSGATC